MEKYKLDLIKKLDSLIIERRNIEKQAAPLALADKSRISDLTLQINELIDFLTAYL